MEKIQKQLLNPKWAKPLNTFKKDSTITYPPGNAAESTKQTAKQFKTSTRAPSPRAVD